MEVYYTKAKKFFTSNTRSCYFYGFVIFVYWVNGFIFWDNRVFERGIVKAIITGDIHTQPGIMVDIVLEFLNRIEEYYFKNKIDYIFFAGDMFEKASKIKYEAFVPFFMKLLEMKEKGIEMIFILGNHDIYSVDNSSIVQTFSAFGKVVKDYERINIQGVDFHFLSYTKDRNLIPSGGDYLITHLDILDFKFDNDYKVQEFVAFSPEDFTNFKQVFSGHYHTYQHKKNIVFQGAPFQHNFNDAGVKKGFVVLDTNVDEWKYVKYTGAPEYIKIKAEEFNEVDVSNKFVAIEITSKIENLVKLKHILFERGAIDVVPVFAKNDSNEFVGTVAIDFNGSVKNLVKEFLEKNVKIEGIENKKLLKSFDKVLEEV